MKKASQIAEQNPGEAMKLIHRNRKIFDVIACIGKKSHAPFLETVWRIMRVPEKLPASPPTVKLVEYGDDFTFGSLLEIATSSREDILYLVCKESDPEEDVDALTQLQGICEIGKNPRLDLVVIGDSFLIRRSLPIMATGAIDKRSEEIGPDLAYYCKNLGHDAIYIVPPTDWGI